MTNAIITNDMRKLMLYRSYTANGSLSSTQYLPPSQFRVGVDQETPSITDTSLTKPIPILYGTVNDDGSNTFTGSSGGDNSTNNTSVFKDGAGVSDDTAQNLIANDTSVTKQWAISNLATAGTVIDTSKYIGLWLYIKDSTALDKFITSSCLQIRLGSDSTNTYEWDYDKADLSTGWNWLYLGTTSDADTTNGTPGTPVDYFAIIITTNNATDEFVAGDVVYDLLRTWSDTDQVKDYETNYPSLNLTNMEVTTRSKLTTVDANGFNIDGYADVNEDTTPLILGIVNSAAESKSDTDEITWVIKDRLI